MIATPDGHDGESFRITQHGYWVGYARSVDELAQWIDLAELEPELGKRQLDRQVCIGLHFGLNLVEPGSLHRRQLGELLNHAL